VARVLVRLEVIEAGELHLVDEQQLKKALRRVRDNPQAGKPLVRELAGCRSIRVGGENRLVYRHDQKKDEVEVLAIERRRDDEAYELARKRI
jgi:mRNA-degrading endonuclease RelE of RelBE toxin-antitoxin system